MKAEHNSIISGSAMAVLLGVLCFFGCWFLPIGIFGKLGIAFISIIVFIAGLIFSRG